MKTVVLIMLLVFAAYGERLQADQGRDLFDVSAKGSIGATGDLGTAELEVLRLFNIERSKGGLCGGTVWIPPSPPLVMDPALRTAARAHSSDMSLRNYFSHTSFDGRTWLDRINGSGFVGYPAGENIAAGYTTPAAVVRGWMSSPGHCRNILSSYSTLIDIGWSYRVSSSYRFYWTADFGTR